MKTILITGSTDGIGLEAAKLLVSQGHRVLLHGRTEEKLVRVASELGGVQAFRADLSKLADVQSLAEEVRAAHSKLDVLINNAGVFHTSNTVAQGIDVRFVVNAVAPYLLTRELLPVLPGGRVINVSSAAQQSVAADAFATAGGLSAGAAYAQSKLALTMWSRALADALGADGPSVVAVNPGSMLGTKMVRDGFGVAGGDVAIGARILVRLALEAEGEESGKYFDNDIGRFGPPHPDALDGEKAQRVVRAIESMLAQVMPASTR
ncbi:MAG: SDR family NAD(P)-dependent oxidoreductase [Myxococcota bacterium]